MRVALLLLLLLACGKSRSDEPATTEPKPQPCKEGERTCNGDMVVMCEHGSPGRQVSTCRGGCKQGACVETCGATDVELIYLVTTDRKLLSFDPRKLPSDPFRVIKPIECENSSTPFSMAVDRTGIAWVLYNSGYLYQVSLVDAHCFTQFARPVGAPRTFGMGFVSDGPKATTEKLYVAADDARDFATINTSVFPTRWQRIGEVVAQQRSNPELTGTADGRLYGYFPGDNDRGFVQELDRGGTGIGERWELPKGEGHASAYAFAFWGDVFYVFLTLQSSRGVERNEVHAIHRKTGKQELVLKASRHRVVGAGVSTCAPLLEKL